MRSATRPDLAIRALGREDLDAVVAIDASFLGRSRRTYFERRRALALEQPALHVQLAAVDSLGLAGCILARRELGEFGRGQPGLRLEVIAVRPDRQGRGVGRRLLDALTSYAARRGIAELRTLAEWNHRRMVRWLDANRFRLAPDRLLECGVETGEQAVRRRDMDMPPCMGWDVRPMRPEDLPQILRIDRGITGHDREAYITDKLREAMDDSAIRVSLTATRGAAVVGFAMARADLGDFGRLEPVTVLDTLAVDPACARRGVGRALVSQLFANFAALQIDRVQTAVRLVDLPLLGLLQSVGFVPSPRLAFVRRVPVGPA